MTEEVKIYRQHGIKEPALSEGEKAAREYRRQQQNGNLERAHRLGENLCTLFLGMPVEGEYAAQQWVLLSYLVENELEQQVENPLLEQSAHSRFAEELEQQAPELARTVHDARAFTLYTLNETRRTPHSEGEIFAKLCGKPEQEEVIALGEHLAEEFTSRITAAVSARAFLPNNRRKRNETMEQNLFTEGVRPGSVTTPEEVHMLICYIFREAGQPVTLDQANEVLQRQSLVNYFEFAEAAERLIRMGHLRPAENGRYTLSPEGEKLADTFRQKLPAAVRERAQRALDDVLTLLRRQQENKVRVKKVGDGYEITLTITDIGSDLMSLTLFLPTEKECEQVRRRFLNDPALLYKGTMALLTGDMETFGDLTPSGRDLFI